MTDLPPGPSFADDPELARLAAEPLAIFRPERPRAPVIFTVPHSGRIYPASLAKASRLDALALRKSEDAFVDELFEAAPRLGAPMAIARFPRVLVDANRAPTELDVSMFDGPLSVGTGPRTARVSAGLGVIPRVVREGVDIYARKLAAGEAAFRLNAFYHPYHQALARLVQETRAQFGVALVVDCHSMPSSVRGADLVLGDRYGESASPQLVAYAQNELEVQGFKVVKNAPYAGGYTTMLYGRPEEGVHALQIEINRGLYLDEARLEKRSDFGIWREKFTCFAARLMDMDPAWLAPKDPSVQIAAQ